MARRERTTTLRRAVLVGAPLGLALLAACGDGGVTSGTIGDAPVLAAEAASDQTFSEVPAFSFTSQANAPVTNADFDGKPYVVAAFFTSCAGPCPKITAAMRRLQEELGDTDVRLLSITVDPETDTPEVLSDYAASYTADTTRWTFATGEADAIHAFLREGLWLPIARAEGVDDPNEALTHSTKLVAVDRHGRTRGWYEGVEADQVAALVERMRFLASER